MEQFNLTPSPALLDLLGKIPFKGWQCVAELIDNSIDAIINSQTQLNDYQKVISVYIPTKGKILENQPLIVEDWGIGMDEQQLESAVRAGFSSKNTNSNLGLFGMGFNVATSRLANTVQVWTSTQEMKKEIGVTIDLRAMKKTGSFIRPKIEREKRQDKQSGTRIEIFDYKPEAQNLLQSRQIVRELNRAYSERIFNEFQIKILINGEEVTPFKFCVWDKSRSVKYKYDDIKAIYEVDEHLGEEMFCENCFAWLGNPVDTTLQLECPYCNTIGRIIKKDIYITGWVGIQRYSDIEHYGIDISRNGRILSKLDKTLFHWDNEKAKDDPRFHPEYPRDTTYAGGRIVGQIEANFLIPKYTKDDFERDDKNWKKVIKHLRGEMPLQPDLAQQLGYKQANRTPMGLLFNGYRKINVPGSKTLVFARENGSVDHITPKNWAHKFYEGDPAYQADIKWWEAVIKADLKETPTTFNPLNPTGKPVALSTGNGTTKQPAAPEKFPGKKILKRTLHLDIEKLIGEKPIDLTLIDYYPTIDINSPIIFESQGTMWKFNVYLNNLHAMFRDFADGYEDLLFMEVAYKYASIKNNEEWTITRIYYELKSKFAPETMLSVPGLVTKASNLMREIQNKLVLANGIDLPRKPDLNESDEKAIIKKYLDLEGKNIPDIKSFILNTRFLKYLDLNYLFKFVEDFPDMIYDGKVLNLPYAELDSESKQHQLKKYTGYFSDVRWFMNDLAKEGDEAVKKLKQQIIRNRYSIEILYGSINK
ncbi:MAG TPA: ATP-binding protein [Parafilimonas sp.]|nr:ATP-binding protein [Parafilimonas sp.]